MKTKTRNGKLQKRSPRQHERLVRQLAPIDCNTFNKVCSLKTDHHDLKQFWILTDSASVSIHEQVSGEKGKQQIIIPKKQFDLLIRWYLKKQQVA